MEFGDRIRKILETLDERLLGTPSLATLEARFHEQQHTEESLNKFFTSNPNKWFYALQIGIETSVGPEQLFPTLRAWTESGFLTIREDDDAGRVFYKHTPRDKDNDSPIIVPPIEGPQAEPLTPSDIIPKLIIGTTALEAYITQQ